MRTTKKRMHGRRRRRSPMLSEEVDLESNEAVNKNASTAVNEAREKGVKNETGSVQTEPNHDTTHSHPATALEGDKQEEEKEMSSRDRARSAVQNLGGSWGRRTFGF